MLKAKKLSKPIKTKRKTRRNDIIRLNLHKGHNLNSDLSSIQNSSSFKPSFKPSNSCDRSKKYLPISERLIMNHKKQYTFIGPAAYTQKYVKKQSENKNKVSLSDGQKRERSMNLKEQIKSSIQSIKFEQSPGMHNITQKRVSSVNRYI